jgi:hypothetical protein
VPYEFRPCNDPNAHGGIPCGLYTHMVWVREPEPPLRGHGDRGAAPRSSGSSEFATLGGALFSLLLLLFWGYVLANSMTRVSMAKARSPEISREMEVLAELCSAFSSEPLLADARIPFRHAVLSVARRYGVHRAAAEQMLRSALRKQAKHYDPSTTLRWVACHPFDPTTDRTFDTPNLLSSSPRD